MIKLPIRGGEANNTWYHPFFSKVVYYSIHKTPNPNPRTLTSTNNKHRYSWRFLSQFWVLPPTPPKQPPWLPPRSSPADFPMSSLIEAHGWARIVYQTLYRRGSTSTSKASPPTSGGTRSPGGGVEGKPESTRWWKTGTKRSRVGFYEKRQLVLVRCVKKTHVSNTHEICFREFSLGAAAAAAQENKVPIE